MHQGRSASFLAYRFRANVEHIRQSGPYSGLDFQAKGLCKFQLVPSSLGSGEDKYTETLNPRLSTQNRPQQAARAPWEPLQAELQGYLAHKKLPTPLGLPQGPRHGPTVGSYGVAVSYKRGTPVHIPWSSPAGDDYAQNPGRLSAVHWSRHKWPGVVWSTCHAISGRG